MRCERQTDDADARLEAASRWFVALDAGTADADTFARWRDADPRNAVAFARIGRSWRAVGALSRDTAPRGDDPAEERDGPSGAAYPQSAARVSRRSVGRIAAAAGLCAALVGGGVMLSSPGEASTRRGQRRIVALSGGDKVMLNGDSAISWDDRGANRSLVLKRGEIALLLTGDTGLELRTSKAAAVALQPGRYNAKLVGGMLDLGVIAGAAAVTATRGGGRPAAIARPVTAKHAILVGNDPHVREIDTVQVAALMAWLHGEIVFDDEPLSSAIQRYNRQAPTPIVIADPMLSRIRIGGRFTTRDPAPFLKALEASFGIRAERGGDTIVLLPQRT